MRKRRDRRIDFHEIYNHPWMSGMRLTQEETKQFQREFRSDKAKDALGNSALTTNALTIRTSGESPTSTISIDKNKIKI